MIGFVYHTLKPIPYAYQLKVLSSKLAVTAQPNVVGHSDGIAEFRKGSPIYRNLHLRNFVILENTNRPYQYD